MKVKYLFLSMLACGVMAACSNDETLTENTGNLKGGEAYIKVRIAMADGAATRADDDNYENGTTEEQAIKSIRFAFFDNSNNFVGYGREIGPTDVTQTPPDQNVEGLADAVVAFEKEEGTAQPTKVVAFVNTIPTFTTTGLTFNTVRSTETSSIGDATNGFVMTNSTYWDNSEQIATPVSATDFYETEEMATASSNPVMIYVERLAAKVEVKQKEDGFTNTPIENDYQKLTFEVEGWALNGLNKTEYYLKHLQDWTSWTWAWNKNTDYRSFWAEDPNYDSMPTGKELDFVSYSEVKNNKKAQYCMENTLTAKLYEDERFEACTHVLVVGKYTVTQTGESTGTGENEDAEKLVDEDGTFYMYAGVAYSTENLMEVLADNDLVFTKDGNTAPQYTPVGTDAYELVQIGGDEHTNKYTLKLNTPTEGTTYYTKDANGQYKEITNYDEFNETLATTIGNAEKYAGGHAYFAVPIEHLAESGDGHIGVVRNHYYKLTINSITGLGEGVTNDNTPIIPEPSADKYFVGATLNILSWHVVEQEVNL